VDLPVYLAAAVAAYLLGSVPTGFLVAKGRGIDIRTTGSGNIGATNVIRAVGKTAGILVLLADALKGAAACLVVPWLALRLFGASHAGAAPGLGLTMVAGVAAILGHNYTCWLQFKGGKGIATSAGVLAVLMPVALGLCVVVWLGVFVLTRYVSAASIAASLALPFAVWGAIGSKPLTVLASVLGALAIYKHKANIRRLLDGTEHRFVRKTMDKNDKSNR